MAIKTLAVGNSNVDQTAHRRLITGLMHTEGWINAKPGLLPGGSGGIAELSNVSAMTAGVGAFRAIIANPSGAEYLVYSDATTNLNFDPGEAAVTRTDRIIIRVYENAVDGSGLNEARVEYLKGQTSGQASPLPASSLLLWEIPVPAGASAGNGGINFTGTAVDKRVYTTASGGVIPVASSSELDTLAGFDGMFAYVKTTNILYVYDGSLFRPVGQLQVASSSNLTDIKNPYSGTLAVTMNDGHVWRWNGTQWVDRDALTIVNTTSSITNVPAGYQVLDCELMSNNERKYVSIHYKTTNTIPASNFANVTIGNIPAAYRPRRDHYGVFSDATGAFGAYVIWTNGDVRILSSVYEIAANGDFTISASYLS